MDDLVERFRRHLETEKRASPHTVRNYLLNVEQLVAFMREKARKPDAKIGPRDVDIPLLRSYLASLFGVNEPATIARKLSAVRAFLRFLRRERVIEENLAMLLRPPKAKKSLPSFLTVEQAGALVEQPTATAQLREAALFEAMYGCGLRVSECVGLDLGDIEAEVVVVRAGKGRKDRIVPLGEKAARAIERWLPSRLALKPTDEALFINARGRRLTAR